MGKIEIVLFMGNESLQEGVVKKTIVRKSKNSFFGMKTHVETLKKIHILISNLFIFDRTE